MRVNTGGVLAAALGMGMAMGTASEPVPYLYNNDLAEALRRLPKVPTGVLSLHEKLEVKQLKEAARLAAGGKPNPTRPVFASETKDLAALNTKDSPYGQRQLRRAQRWIRNAEVEQSAPSHVARALTYARDNFPTEFKEALKARQALDAGA